MSNESFEDYYNRRTKEEWKWSMPGVYISCFIWIVVLLISYIIIHG